LAATTWERRGLRPLHPDQTDVALIGVMEDDQSQRALPGPMLKLHHRGRRDIDSRLDLNRLSPGRSNRSSCSSSTVMAGVKRRRGQHRRASDRACSSLGPGREAPAPWGRGGGGLGLGGEAVFTKCDAVALFDTRRRRMSYAGI
jgi:hypothetical protein